MNFPYIIEQDVFSSLNLFRVVIPTATQLLSRGITFLFNTWIIRHLSEADLAVNSSVFYSVNLFPFLRLCEIKSMKSV